MFNVSAAPLRDKPVILVGPKHFGYNLNAYIFTPVGARPVKRAAVMPEIIAANAAFRQLVPRANYQDLLATMDSKFGGVPVFDSSGRILSADRVHLTEAGAKFFATFAFDDPVWRSVWSLEAQPSPSRR